MDGIQNRATRHMGLLGQSQSNNYRETQNDRKEPLNYRKERHNNYKEKQNDHRETGKQLPKDAKRSQRHKK